MPVTPEHDLYRALLASHRTGLAEASGTIDRRQLHQVPDQVRSALGELAALWTSAGAGGPLTITVATAPAALRALAAPGHPDADSVLVICADIGAACGAAGPAGYGEVLLRASAAAHAAAAGALRAGWRAAVTTVPAPPLSRGPLSQLCGVALYEPDHGASRSAGTEPADG
jgi:hypothetical protein